MNAAYTIEVARINHVRARPCFIPIGTTHMGFWRLTEGQTGQATIDVLATNALKTMPRGLSQEEFQAAFAEAWNHYGRILGVAMNGRQNRDGSVLLNPDEYGMPTLPPSIRTVRQGESGLYTLVYGDTPVAQSRVLTYAQHRIFGGPRNV